MKQNQKRREERRKKVPYVISIKNFCFYGDSSFLRRSDVLLRLSCNLHMVIDVRMYKSKIQS